MNSNPLSQSGNALWFILLAVALLGFLTAVVSRTSSTVEQTGDVEQARIKASALLRYSAGIEAAVQQMTLNGISESDLDFKAIGPELDNTNCGSPYCEIFNAAGGGLDYRTPSEVTGLKNFEGNWTVNSANRINQVGCNDETPDCAELLFILANIPKALCLQINKLQEIKNPAGEAPLQAKVILAPPFTGQFIDTNPNIIGGTNESGESPELQGKIAGCVLDGASHGYVFYQVLVAR